MLTFEYVAKDSKSGKERKGQIESASEASAAKALTKQGLMPTAIVLQSSKNKLFRGLRERISSKDKVLFSRQLATLINAGMPLSQSLRSVGEQTANKIFVMVINKVISDIEGGMAFSKALEIHPRVFNKVFTSLISAGESSGTLGDALERLATQQEKDAEIKSKVQGALIYPAIVLFVIGGVIIFMLTTVLPQVEQLYVDLKQELPFITATLLMISRLIINFWWLLIMIDVGLIILAKRYFETDDGRRVKDRIIMKIPMFGKLFRKLYMARFARTGQTLMAAGVPMLEMMRITGHAVNNVIVEAAVIRASEKVKGGKALSDSLAVEPETFLPLMPQMLKIGEESGAIDDMMDKAATFYEHEIDNAIKTISTTIEPILMVVLAAVAALMVGAILLPVYGLVGSSLAF